MILRQFLHQDPVAISYLFGCGGHAAAAVVDPVGDFAALFEAADDTGMRIPTLSTPISMPIIFRPEGAGRGGGRRLRSVRRGGGRLPIQGRLDGDVLELGNVTINRHAHARPHARSIFRFLSLIGRAATTLVRAYRPYADGRRSWSNGTGVKRRGRRTGPVSERSASQGICPITLKCYRGPFRALSADVPLSGKPTSTIGFEKRHNMAFRIDDEAAFVQFMFADIPPAPPSAAVTRASERRLAATP